MPLQTSQYKATWGWIADGWISDGDGEARDLKFRLKLILSLEKGFEHTYV